ncbi:MAG: hypothetical protein RSE54_01495 [Ruthenibacterium sp.]
MKTQFSMRKNTAFYVEIVLLVLFVLLSTSVLVRVFAKAQWLDRRAEQLSQSVTLAQSAAETFAATDSEQELLQLLPQRDGICTLYYDAKGAEAKKKQTDGYTVTITTQKKVQTAGTLCHASIAVQAEGRSAAYYCLETARYWNKNDEGREESEQ